MARVEEAAALPASLLHASARKRTHSHATPQPSTRPTGPPTCVMQPLRQVSGVQLQLKVAAPMVQQQHAGHLDPMGCGRERRVAGGAVGGQRWGHGERQAGDGPSWQRAAHTTQAVGTSAPTHPPSQRSSSLCSTSSRSLLVSASSCSRGCTSTLQRGRVQEGRERHGGAWRCTAAARDGQAAAWPGKPCRPPPPPQPIAAGALEGEGLAGIVRFPQVDAAPAGAAVAAPHRHLKPQV